MVPRTHSAQARSLGRSFKPTLRVITDPRTAAVYHSATFLPKDGSDEQVYAPRMAMQCNRNPSQLSQALPLMTCFHELMQALPSAQIFSKTDLPTPLTLVYYHKALKC